MVTQDTLQRIQATLPDDPAQDAPAQADVRDLLRAFATLGMALPSARMLATIVAEVFAGLQEQA